MEFYKETAVPIDHFHSTSHPTFMEGQICYFCTLWTFHVHSL